MLFRIQDILLTECLMRKALWQQIMLPAHFSGNFKDWQMFHFVNLKFMEFKALVRFIITFYVTMACDKHL